MFTSSCVTKPKVEQELVFVVCSLVVCSEFLNNVFPKGFVGSI